MAMTHRSLTTGLLGVLAATMIGLAACGAGNTAVAPTRTPEPIVPTRTPAVDGGQASPQPTATVQTMTATAVASPTAMTPTATPREPTAVPEERDDRQVATLVRFGLTGAAEYIEPALAAGLPFGSYLNWNLLPDRPKDSGIDYWQMVRLSEDGVVEDWDNIEAVLAANPGSKWLVGNEPDVRWQDNVTAEYYAELYHDVYTFIKDHDPTAQVAAGGIAQVSSLRLAYLDRVLEAYQQANGRPLPVDIWSIHTFILREESDSWGVGIPPGMDETAGNLYEIDDHDDIRLLREQIEQFRSWMAANGYRDTSLAVTEYGILLPSDYGFPPEEVVRFMAESFAYFESAVGDTGNPADENRLVQWWFWYSLSDDGAYPTGNLIEPGGGPLTQLGQAYKAMVEARMMTRPVTGE